MYSNGSGGIIWFGVIFAARQVDVSVYSILKPASKVPARIIILEVPVLAVCEIKGGQGGSDPLKSMRDPCKVVICRDPGWVP